MNDISLIFGSPEILTSHDRFRFLIALNVAYLCRILSLLSFTATTIFAAVDFFATSFSLTFATISSTACNGEVRGAYSVHHIPVYTRHFLKNRGSIWKNDEAMRFLNALTEDRRLIISSHIFLKKWRAEHTQRFFGQIWGFNNDHTGLHVMATRTLSLGWRNPDPTQIPDPRCSRLSGMPKSAF